jgi:hypothetical protein
MTVRLVEDFKAGETAASRSALLELVLSLKMYSRALVLVGGWVPYFLLRDHPRAGEPFFHVGSLDIDFVIDPEQIGEDEYQTIVSLIADVGWKGIPDKKFSFEREVVGPDQVPYAIKVDFLTPELAGLGGKHRHRQLQPDLQARTMHGAELALAHRDTCHLEGTLPGGAETRADFLMLDVAGCLGTKGIALGERFKHKDAYDIVSVLDNYGQGVKEAASFVRPFRTESLMSESLGVLADKFRSERAEGPTWYAEFMGGDADAKSRHAQRAYQLVNELGLLLS